MKRLVKRRSASDKVTAHLTIGGNPVAPNALVAADLNARSDSINVKKNEIYSLSEVHARRRSTYNDPVYILIS
jgi:hypothetical protein